MSTDREPDAHSISPRMRLTLVALSALLVLWFLFAWLILDRHILDAAGESVGTALALGVLASIVGAFRGSR